MFHMPKIAPRLLALLFCLGVTAAILIFTCTSCSIAIWKSKNRTPSQEVRLEPGFPPPPEDYFDGNDDASGGWWIFGHAGGSSEDSSDE